MTRKSVTTVFLLPLLTLCMLILPNDAIAKEGKKAKKKKANFQFNIGYLNAFDAVGVYYINAGIKIGPKLYVGPYLEWFRDDYSFDANLFTSSDEHYNERVEGINFGASILYKKRRWFFLGTLAPFGSSKLKNRRPNTVGKPNDVTKPVLWGVTVGYLIIPKIHFNLLTSYFSRQYRDDPTDYYENNSFAIGFGFKFHLKL